MSRMIEVTAAAVFALATGGFVAFAEGTIGLGSISAMMLGGCVGAMIAATGVDRIRRASKAPSILISATRRRDMESALHIALASAWALRPLIEADTRLGRDIVDTVFKMCVENYTREVTPYVQEMQHHLRRAVASGIRPDASMAHVRRNYAPRMMRKDDSVSFLIARNVLDVQAQHGPTVESREWFARWCEFVGLGRYADAMWQKHFGQHEPVTIDEWKDERRRTAMASYYDDEAA